MYNDPIERLSFQKKQKINTNLIVLLAIVLIAYFANTSHSQIIKYVTVMVLVTFSYYLIMNVKKEGFAAGFCVLLGCIIITSTILISNGAYYNESPTGKYHLFVETMVERIQNLQSSREFLHLYSLFIGSFCIGLGLIFAYKPSLIQLKNHLPFEYPYPIWNSKNQQITQFSKNLISVKEFLTYKEKMLLCRFRYLLVSIDGKLYLVSPNETIPHDSIIIRTKSSKTLCGISRF